MNWGTKIFIVFVVFVTGIVFMVFKSSIQKTDLVTSDYYAKELKYQDRIEEIRRVEALSAPIKYYIVNKEVVIEFPADFKGKLLTGEAVLYCPSDENKDVKQHFLIKDEPVKIKAGDTIPGVYQLQLTWKDTLTSYYFEKKIFL